MRVLITGGAGFKNAGDEALLLAAVQIIRCAAPEARLCIAANNEEVAGQTLSGIEGIDTVPSARLAFFRNDSHYFRANRFFLERCATLRKLLIGLSPNEAMQTIERSPKLDFIDRVGSVAFLRALADSDVVVVHGGGFLTSYTRSRLIEHALTVELAASWGKRVLLRSQQIGPLNSDEDRDLMRSILNAAAYVSTRDKDQSSRLSQEIAPGVAVVDAPDDALMLDLGVSRDGVLAKYGLLRRRYTCVGFRYNQAVGLSDEAYPATAAIIAQVRAQLAGPIVLLPQGPFDIEPLKMLSSHLDFEVRIIELDDPFRDSVVIAENARLMVACPHHSLIFALRGAVPVVSLVLGDYYRFKNTGSMRLFGLERFVIDLAASPDDLYGTCNRLLRDIFDDEEAFRENLALRVEEARAIAFAKIEAFKTQLVGMDQPQAAPPADL